MENHGSETPPLTDEALAFLFKILGHANRLAILRLLEFQELCVCEIETALDLRQAYISQQLMLLRQAGLVCFRKEGWNVRYRIARPEVYALLAMAQDIHAKLGQCAWVNPEEAVPATCAQPGPVEVLG